MSEQPLTFEVLARFHQEVILPDIQRIVSEAVSGSEQRLRHEIQTFQDAFLTKFDRLETEYQAVKAGLGRVEQRLDGLEQRLGRVEQRLDGLEQRLGRVEQRLDGLEQRLDVLATSQRDLLVAVHRLDERLSRVEKRLDDLERRLAAGDPVADRAELQDLKARVEALQAQVDALAKRIGRG